VEELVAHYWDNSGYPGPQQGGNSYPYAIEMWNEPDAPEGNTPVGCWGNAATPYFGGRFYGDFLKAVHQKLNTDYSGRIPFKVVFGGLMIASEPIPSRDQSDYFDGAVNQMAAGVPGAGCNYFDAVSFHHYVTVNQWENYQTGLSPATQVSVLSTVMANYYRCQGNEKPIWWTESGMRRLTPAPPTCPPNNGTPCSTQTATAWAKTAAPVNTQWAATEYPRRTQVAWHQAAWATETYNYMKNQAPSFLKVWLWYALNPGWESLDLIYGPNEITPTFMIFFNLPH
jgi:hypothetical protein